MSEYEYPGDELGIFAHAHNWKNYFRTFLQPHIRGQVMEVGAGIGTTTAVLHSGSEDPWICLEPDAALLQRLRTNIATLPKHENIEIRQGTLSEIDDAFDTILYIDVLEHIEDDRSEMIEAARHLNPGGSLIVLAPAHAMLYSEFDKAIGHFRRYTARTLREVAPEGVVEKRVFYLDALGMLLSLANRAILRRDLPSLANITFWDRFVVPVSKILDPKVGKPSGFLTF